MCQPTESTSAPPTNNPDNKESTDDNNNNNEDGGGQGNGETMVGGKKRASNEANEAVASTKRKMPVIPSHVQQYSQNVSHLVKMSYN